MSIAAWAVLIWFGVPAAFVAGAMTALITRSRSGHAWPFVRPFAVAAPWLLIAIRVRNSTGPWLVVLVTAWSAGCLVASAAVRYRRS